MIENLVQVEQDFFLLLNSPHTPYLDSVMYIISAPLVWIIFALVFIFMMTYKQKSSEWLCFFFFFLLLFFLADQVSSGIIKPYFQRLRPTHHPLTYETVKTVLGYRGGLYGFISGHTANFIALATFLSLFVRSRRFTIAIFTVALTVCYSRIYLGVHFITDVLPAIVVGVMIGYIVYSLYIRARVHFLEVPEAEAKTFYLHPRQSMGKTLLLTVILFYIAVWAFSPLLIHVYGGSRI